MLSVLLSLAVVALVAGATVTVHVLLARRSALGVRRRVLVNLVDGNAVDGVLWARRGRFLVLKDCTLHGPGGSSTSVDGEVVIEQARVDFLQIAGG